MCEEEEVRGREMKEKNNNNWTASFLFLRYSALTVTKAFLKKTAILRVCEMLFLKLNATISVNTVYVTAFYLFFSPPKLI